MAASTETTTPAADKRSFGPSIFLLWFFVILLFYSLSAGPALMMADKYLKINHGVIRHEDVYLWFYGPLMWAYEKTPLHKPLGKYLHLWSEDFNKDGEYVIRIF